MDRRRTDKNEEASAQGRPTLKTLAFMTGLGVTTVSRALKDAPEIGAETKRRVQLVAKQIGYRPNRAGVRLRTGKTNVSSLIMSVETEVLGLTSHLVYGISEYLSGSPYHLIVTPYTLRSDPLDPVRYIVETASADGIIFSRIEPQDARVVRVAEPRRAPGHGLQHRLQFSRRAGDHPQDLGGGGLLLQAVLELLEQPGVLDGDHGLVGKGLHEGEVALAVRLGDVAEDDEQAKRLLLA